jgi:hypothetical protein
MEPGIANPLLRVAQWLCGRSLTTSVLEPLVADWDRERREASAAPAPVRAAIATRWSAAFARTLITCAARHFMSVEGAMWKCGLAMFAGAVALSIAAETVIIRVTAAPDYTWELLLIAALMRTGIATLAPAMLPAMFLLRRDAKVRGRVAAGWIASGAATLAVAVMAQQSIENYMPTFGQNERMYQRALANDRAGRLQYPGSARRALSADTTLEQRKARYDAFVAWRAQTLAAETPRPIWYRLRYSTAPVMAVIFGAIGWALGGLTRPTVSAAAMWWLAAWLTSLLIEGRVTNVLGLPHPIPAWWVFPVLMSLAALSLTVAARRRQALEGA